MAIKNAKVSEFIWYGLSTAVVYFGISAFKPRYFYTFATVQNI